MPWPGDRAAAAAALGRFKFTAAPALYWLSDGIEDGKQPAAARRLQALWRRHRCSRPSSLALGLLPVTRDASGFALTAIRAKAGAAAGYRSRRHRRARRNPGGDAACISSRGDTDGPRPYRPADGSAQRHRAAGDHRRGQRRRGAAAGQGRGPAQRRHRFGNRQRRSTSRCCPMSIIWNGRCRPMPKSPRAPSRSCWTSMSRCCCWPMWRKFPAPTWAG